MKKIVLGLSGIAITTCLIATASLIFFRPSTPKPISVDNPLFTDPARIPTSDGKSYFLFGRSSHEPTTGPKKLIITLPGHGTEAEQGYEAWIPHLQDLDYDLAVLNWWDGKDEKPGNYYRPGEIVQLTKDFVNQEGFSDTDLIILEGFSRGSANTYAVIANQKKMGLQLFDGAIANAGKYQENFPVFLSGPQPTSAEWDTYLTNTYWVLACGGQDPNPDRDGCPAMNETKLFLESHGAHVLDVLEDPNEGHGAFHMSSLQLPKQALQLFETSLPQ